MNRVAKLRVPSWRKKHTRTSQVGQQLMSGSRDGSVRLWNLEEKKKNGRVLFKDTTAVKRLSMSRDGRRVVECSYGDAQVWDISTRKPIARLFCGAREVALNGDGSQLLFSNSDCVAVWDVVETGKETLDMSPFGPGVRSSIRGIGCSADMEIWDYHQESLFLFSIEGYLNLLAISRSGTTVAASFVHPHFIRVWDVQTRAEIAKIVVEFGISNLGISRDGKYIFYMFGREMYIWDISGSVPNAIPRDQVPRSVQQDVDSAERQAEDPDWVVVGGEQQPNSLEHEGANSFDILPANSQEWKLTVDIDIEQQESNCEAKRA